MASASDFGGAQAGHPVLPGAQILPQASSVHQRGLGDQLV
jgi:hypothetical protein